MKKFLKGCLLIALFITCGAFNCDNNDETITLNGTYVSNCYWSDPTYRVDTMVFSGDNLTWTEDYYTDSGCSTPTGTPDVKNSKYEIGDEFTAYDGETVREFDFIDPDSLEIVFWSLIYLQDDNNTINFGLEEDPDYNGDSEAQRNRKVDYSSTLTKQ